MNSTETFEPVVSSAHYCRLRNRAMEMQRSAEALIAEIDQILGQSVPKRSSVRISIRPTPMEVAVEIARIFNLQVSVLLGKERPRTIVDARHTTFWFGYMLSGQSMNQVGISLGGFDHVTVINGTRKVQTLYGSDMQFRLRHEAIEHELCSLFRMKATPNPAIGSPTINFSPL